MNDDMKPSRTDSRADMARADARQTMRLRHWLATMGPPARTLRWVAAFALASAVVGTAISATASGGPGIGGLVSQVQRSFGDGRLVSASVSGSTLNTTLAVPDEPSAVSATFEAQMLAAAVHDSIGQAHITAVEYTSSNDAMLQGYGPDPVGSTTSPAGLGTGACNSAAQAAEAADASLTVASVLTLPYAGGACVFKFQSSDPSSFASNAPLTIGTLVNAMGNPNERPYLVEVDDQTGIPQFVDSYTPNAGGVTYIRPGLDTSFNNGGRLAGP